MENVWLLQNEQILDLINSGEMLKFLNKIYLIIVLSLQYFS